MLGDTHKTRTDERGVAALSLSFSRVTLIEKY